MWKPMEQGLACHMRSWRYEHNGAIRNIKVPLSHNKSIKYFQRVPLGAEGKTKPVSTSLLLPLPLISNPQLWKSESFLSIQCCISQLLFWLLCFLLSAYFSLFLDFFFFFFLVFSGPPLQHMEVPRLGVELGATAASHSHSNARSKPLLRPTSPLTATPDPHWVRPEIEPVSSWLLVRFISAEPQWELPFIEFLFSTF